MEERIKIENFGCIEYLELKLNVFNVLIGQQAAGKSLTAKLLYFFKDISDTLKYSVKYDFSYPKFKTYLERKFLCLFPYDTWNNKYFNIRYDFGDIYIQVTNHNQELEIVCSNALRDILKLYKELFKNSLKVEQFEDDYRPNSFHQLVNEIQEEYGKPFAFKQIFIPAGRSFFASVQDSIFTMLSDDQKIDPFIIEFGSYYERAKKSHRISAYKKPKIKIIDRLIHDILRANYLHKNNEDYLIHEDDRMVKLNIASSGQQETLPLALILRHLSSTIFVNNGATVYIEEPEAHLYPESQKAMVELIATVANLASSPLQFIITTHSPYILSSFNNLLEAGNIIQEQPQKAAKVHNIIDKSKILQFDDLNAYSLENGSCRDILDYEMKLISPTLLDRVSNNIAIEFGKLLDL